jgi:hypothetical protein
MSNTCFLAGVIYKDFESTIHSKFGIVVNLILLGGVFFLKLPNPLILPLFTSLIITTISCLSLKNNKLVNYFSERSLGVYLSQASIFIILEGININIYIRVFVVFLLCTIQAEICDRFFKKMCYEFKI